MMTIITASRFPLGPVLLINSVDAELTEQDVVVALQRHADGDWGDLDEFDWKLNDEALECEGRLRSRFRASRGIWFWVITDLKRPVTWIQLPGEH